MITGDAIRVAPTAEALARSRGYEPVRVPYLSVPYAQMPSVLNQYRAVVVDPVMMHAGARLVVEAMACGCEVLVGPRVCTFSWPDPIAASGRANTGFWNMVLDRPGHGAG